MEGKGASDEFVHTAPGADVIKHRKMATLVKG